MTVKDLLTEYLSELSDEGARALQVDYQLRPLTCLIGHKELTDLTARGLEEYRRARREQTTRYGTPPAHATINRELGYFRAALNRAWKRGDLPAVPWIRMAKENGRRYDWCPVEVLEAILARLRERQCHEVIADLVEAYFFTGWRRRELLELTWREVRLTAREPLIELPAERSKSGEPRVFPLGGRLLAGFERRLAARWGDFVWHRRGRPIRDFRRLWQRVAAEVGHPGLCVHGMRRTFAFYSVSAGTPQSITMRLAGWQTDSIFRRYMIYPDRLLRKHAASTERYIRDEWRGAV